MAYIVLDSSAILCLLRGEPRSIEVRQILEKAAEKDIPVHMTEVDYAEIKYSVIQKEGRDEWNRIEALTLSALIKFHTIDRNLADLAAEFRLFNNCTFEQSLTQALIKKLKCRTYITDIKISIPVNFKKHI